MGDLAAEQATGICRLTARSFECHGRGRNRGVDVFCASDRHGTDDRTVIRIDDFFPNAGVDPLTVDEEISMHGPIVA